MDSFKIGVVLLLCISSAGFAAAWGEETQKYVCEAAVEKAWGTALADKCLAATASNKESLCLLMREIRGEEEYLSCMLLSEVHPALVPYLVFNDTALHRNYEECPIPRSDAQLRSWACNMSGENLAMEQADLWLSSMNESVGCDRIYRFCIGANYFSDSFMPLYQVMYATPASVTEMDDRVDKMILEGKKPWGLDVSAAFQLKNKPRSVRRFEVNSRMFDDIVNRLAAAAGKQPETAVKPAVESCSDGIRNQDETEVDCGGRCPPCKVPEVESCSDGIRNQDETEVDCGGRCAACPPHEEGGFGIPGYVTQALIGIFIIAGIFLVLALVAVVVVTIVRSRRRQESDAVEPAVEAGLDEALEPPEPPRRTLPKKKPEVTDESGLDEIGDRLNDIRSTLKRLE